MSYLMLINVNLLALTTDRRTQTTRLLYPIFTRENYQIDPSFYSENFKSMLSSRILWVNTINIS